MLQHLLFLISSFKTELKNNQLPILKNRYIINI